MKKLWWYVRLGLWLRVYGYGMSLTRVYQTGCFEEWRDAGYSPREAVQEDLSYLLEEPKMEQPLVEIALKRKLGTQR